MYALKIAYTKYLDDHLLTPGGQPEALVRPARSRAPKLYSQRRIANLRTTCRQRFRDGLRVDDHTALSKGRSSTRLLDIDHPGTDYWEGPQEGRLQVVHCQFEAAMVASMVAMRAR